MQFDIFLRSWQFDIFLRSYLELVDGGGRKHRHLFWANWWTVEANLFWALVTFCQCQTRFTGRCFEFRWEYTYISAKFEMRIKIHPWHGGVVEGGMMA